MESRARSQPRLRCSSRSSRQTRNGLYQAEQELYIIARLKTCTPIAIAEAAAHLRIVMLEDDGRLVHKQLTHGVREREKGLVAGAQNNGRARRPLRAPLPVPLAARARLPWPRVQLHDSRAQARVLLVALRERPDLKDLGTGARVAIQCRWQRRRVAQDGDEGVHDACDLDAHEHSRGRATGDVRGAAPICVAARLHGRDAVARVRCRRVCIGGMRRLPERGALTAYCAFARIEFECSVGGKQDASAPLQWLR